jgi:hypothetical protein
MNMNALNRRDFLAGMGAGTIALPGLGLSAQSPTRSYQGPNVVIIRFGGGVRRNETINPKHSYAPNFLKILCPQGVLFENMRISRFVDPVRPKQTQIETSHGQGTLYILRGKYERYEDVENKFLAARVESSVPTVFEYLRKSYDIPEHQTLIINGEDRKDEEFYTFGNHKDFGMDFRGNTLSLFRYKTWLLRRQLAEGKFDGQELKKKTQELDEMVSIDYRTGGKMPFSAAQAAYWDNWRRRYGDSGLKNARGDRLLTDLAIGAMRHNSKSPERCEKIALPLRLLVLG